ncbi:hypothetical protein TUM4438_33890 [Shewanella sairae]|uniref:Uncharacterized protein n=1 Tax=Shewanella sairae TaxID=190310 RepID=A0ABQ4PMY5_9GAMM|nr:hypothetical protein [Shewanella sairae]MCL1130132.1 hypothetical protein [Shewanella sairae]GIU49709.1 hypothetical protein TUM4438_33890 [Shewanella sairae]
MDETDFTRNNYTDNSTAPDDSNIYDTVHIDGQFIVERRTGRDNRSNSKLRAYDRRQSPQSCLPDIDIYI